MHNIITLIEAIVSTINILLYNLPVPVLSLYIEISLWNIKTC